MWLEKDYTCPLMLIPYRAPSGLVQGCQIRFMYRRAAVQGVRYVWLSTPDKTEGGVGCGSPLHFASYDATAAGKPIVITEGALKAETIARFFKKRFDVLAVAGVSCSHKEIASAINLRTVYTAFDNDCRENRHVARAFAELVNSILLSTGEEADRAADRIKVLTWNSKFKGIDDALLQNVPLRSQSLFEWHRSLGRECREETAQILPVNVLK